MDKPPVENMFEKPRPKVLRTHFEIHTRCKGALQPFYDHASTLNEAYEVARPKSKSLGLEIVHLDWRTDLKSATADGVYICEVRRDTFREGCQRVWE
jgi:hypothetical protein